MPHTTTRTPEERIAFRKRCLRLAAAGGFVALVGATLVGGPALAGHGDVTLAGSNFEIDTNANLKVDHAAPSVDWASFAHANPLVDPEKRKADLASGGGDDSFGQGSKEDTPVPTVVDGSIPPNKSDLKNFGIYLEETAGDDFLHMFWHRVQDPSGTTNMDFEFNKNKADPALGNGVTPIRSDGDLLIQYDLANGGTSPELFLSRWVATGPKSLCEAANSTPCWGVRINLSDADDATGSINTSAIPAAESDGLGSVSARTFGEASVNFSEIVGDDECVALGSAYLKSRSSDSFTAAMKDFIAPIDTGIDTCGALVISKTAKHAESGPGDHPQADVEFTVTGGGLVDPLVGTTDADGLLCFEGLTAGTYTVTETVPDGYVSADAEQDGTVVAQSDCDTATPVEFSNTPLTDLTVSVDSQVDGGTFSSISCDVDGSDEVLLTDEIDDPSVTITDLEPRTVVCTIVIDP
ncbi:prealbumin-like fold domain-containing protein [Agromyces sp. NPDC056523]|uniref:prealbumin-like fold domain-containing protein n=1 Tax=Agromyces sp. NPDC056523 TaxID=3345850 RepID=UPI003672A15E